METKQLKEGEKCIIDKGFQNSGEVTLVRLGRLFATVKDEDSEWETMVNRLSPIEQGNEPAMEKENIQKLAEKYANEYTGYEHNHSWTIVQHGFNAGFKAGFTRNEAITSELVEALKARKKRHLEFQKTINVPPGWIQKEIDFLQSLITKAEQLKPE